MPSDHTTPPQPATGVRLVIAGLGYSGMAVGRLAAAAGMAVTGTYRRALPAVPEGTRVVAFDAAGPAIRAATHLLVTAAPGESGDPVLARFAAEIAQAPALRWIGYLSTTGVYGDRAGGWVDETTPPAPTNDRSRRRVAAEDAWAALAGATGAGQDQDQDQDQDRGQGAGSAQPPASPSPPPLEGGNWGEGFVAQETPRAPTPPPIPLPQGEGEPASSAGSHTPTPAVDIFRLAGIYGPGRSVLDDVAAGRARRIIRPGHAFGRIHRDDIARAVLAAILQDPPAGVRIFNLTDDEPAESAEVIAEAARLLGAPLPPAVPFDEAVATMSPMARGFWAESRRVACARTKATLGLDWLYGTYREGLAAILAEQRGERPA